MIWAQQRVSYKRIEALTCVDSSQQVDAESTRVFRNTLTEKIKILTDTGIGEFMRIHAFAPLFIRAHGIESEVL